MPPTKTWKQKERKAAAKFGALRNVLSGSSGRDDRSRSDSTHSTIFLECKYRQRHAVRALFDKTQELAKREGKTPVLALADKGRKGMLFVVHEDDLDAVMSALAAMKASNMELDRSADYEGIDDGS